MFIINPEGKKTKAVNLNLKASGSSLPPHCL